MNMTNGRRRPRLQGAALLAVGFICAVLCNGVQAAACSDLGAQLRNAAFTGKLPEVQSLVEQGADINAANEHGVTPLCCAALFGYQEIIGLLVEQGANVNTADENGYTPLHLAAWCGYLSVVQCLVANGALVNVVARDGKMPLCLAAEKGELHVVRYLEDHGALQWRNEGWCSIS